MIYRRLLLTLAVLMLLAVAASAQYSATLPAISPPDECSVIALAIDATTAEGVIEVMRGYQKSGPVHLSVVNTTGRVQRTKDGRPCEALLLDVRLMGERVFSVVADVRDGRPWYRRLWP